MTADSVYCNWISGFHKADPDETLFEPCELLDKLVADGKLGRKAGQGFYSYDKNKKWMQLFMWHLLVFFQQRQKCVNVLL